MPHMIAQRILLVVFTGFILLPSTGWSVEQDSAPFSADVLSPRVRGLYNRGAYHKLQGQLDSAKIYIQQAAALAPRIAELQLALARIFYLQGELVRLQELSKPRYSELSFFRNASSAIEKALSIAPDDINALTLGARILQEFNDVSSLQKVDEFIARAIAIAPNHTETRYLRVINLWRTGSLLKAHTLAKELLLRNPDNFELSLINIKLDILTSPSEEACEQYLTALSKETLPTVLYHEFKHVSFLLSPYEQQIFSNLPEQKKGNFIAQFWRRNNPEPYSLFNRRVVEHLERTHVALLQYRTKNAPGYDDRGKIYVRYGHPHDYFEDSGTMVSSPNQSWVYRYPFGDLQFDFVKLQDTYQLTETLQPAVRIADRSQYVRQTCQLYEARKHLGDFYLSLAHNYNDTQLKYAKRLKKENLSKAPATFYQLPFTVTPITIWTSNASYRNPDGSTRFEVHYALPSRSLPFSKSLFGAGKCILQSHMLAADIDLQPMFYDKKFLTFWLNPEDSTTRSGLVLGSQSIAIAPGDFLLHMGMQTLDRHQRAVVQDTVDVPDYNNKQLQLSPLQFSFRIDEPATINPQNAYHGYQVFTYPINTVIRKTPLYVYAEVYGLQRPTFQQAAYTVQCEIRPLIEKQTVSTLFSKLLNRYQYTPPFTYAESKEIESSSDFLYTLLDLSSVPLGWNLLQLTVTDEGNGSSYSRSQLFEVVTPEGFQAKMQGVQSTGVRKQTGQPIRRMRSIRRGGRRNFR